MSLKRRFLSFIKLRQYSTQIQSKTLPIVDSRFELPEPEYNTDFLCNLANRNAIFDNIKRRKGIGNIDKILELSQNPEMEDALKTELSKIPNCTDPKVLEYGDDPVTLKVCGSELKYDFAPKEFSDLAKSLRLLRTDNLGPLAGQRSYILIGDLAELEEALIHYTIKELMKKEFKLVSVPDIIPTKVIERCGLIVDGKRTLVYSLDSYYGDDLSLSGTAEMSLACKLMNMTLSEDELPLRLAAVSRCYRAEASSLLEERGIYRVHQFTKVEMFACCEQEKSAPFLNELQAIEEELFLGLGLHFKVLDMPPHELGAPAYRKLDMEGWLPGRKQFGELSSCSNCTDFQSRRLNIKYTTGSGKRVHVHTLNGTACAIPRMLIAICETHQTKDGNIKVPEKLIPFMKGKTIIRKQPLADMRTFKYKSKLH